MFAGNTAAMIMKEMAQWQVNGEISGSDDIAPGGCFYDEAVSEIQSALIQGGFPTDYTDSSSIAYKYIAALHRKLTAMLYIQARRINITVDGEDSSRGIWAGIRNKLRSIAKGEPFGELKTPAGSINRADFFSMDASPFYDPLPLGRSL